jgi:hypothetical protein
MTINDKTPLSIILFSHTTFHEKINRILELLPSYQVTILDEKSDLSIIDWSLYDSVILIYSEDLKEDPNLYKFVKQLEKYPSLERFLFLPQAEQKSGVFPSILHSLRFFEHHLIFYTSKEELLNTPDSIEHYISEPLLKLAEKKESNLLKNSAKRSKNLIQLIKASWKNPLYRMLVFFSPLLAMLIVLLISLFPNTLNAIASSRNPTPQITPPPLDSLVVDSSLEQISASSQWVVAQKYKGPNLLTAEFSNSDESVISGKSAISDALLEMTEGDTKYRFDDFYVFKVPFLVDPLTDEKSSSVITFQLKMADQSDNRIGCMISPGKSQGNIQCFAEDPQVKTEITAPINFSVSDWHTFTLVRNPETNTLQFFLDDVYYGISEIPSSADWINKNYSLSIITEVKNLTSGNFLAKVGNIKIAKLPKE